MAVVHNAAVTPSRQKVVEIWANKNGWGGVGSLESLGSYRLDDPAGEVGIEGHIAKRDHGALLHIPLTYRGAPLPELEQHLVATMEHSVLGQRWVYDAAADPVALECYLRALRGEQREAQVEFWDRGRAVQTYDSVVHLSSEGHEAGQTIQVVHEIDKAPNAPCRLLARWPSGLGVVAYSLTPTSGAGLDLPET